MLKKSSAMVTLACACFLDDISCSFASRAIEHGFKTMSLYISSKLTRLWIKTSKYVSSKNVKKSEKTNKTNKT